MRVRLKQQSLHQLIARSSLSQNHWALALLMGARIEGLLFDTSPRDPVAYGVAIGAVLLISLVATVFPGLRASRVDPLIALRAE